MKTWKTYLAIATISALALLGVAYYSYISPILTLERIKNAAKASDKDRLRDLVDFESVRAGLKEDIKAQLVVSAGETLKDNPFAAFGMALAGMVVDPLVDFIVSPAGITRLMENGRLDPVDKGSERAPAGKSPGESSPEGSVILEQGYDEFSRYRVRIGRAGEEPDRLLTLTLKREGLFGWRLTRVSVPSGLLGSRTNRQADPGLQRRADLLAIASSDLQVVAGQENVIALNAVLRNEAKSFPQEFPALELTLSNERDEAVARRVLLPSDYLAGLAAERIARGIAPGDDVPLRVHFELSGVKAAGYQMYIFYPLQDAAPARRQINPDSIRILPAAEFARLPEVQPR